MRFFTEAAHQLHSILHGELLLAELHCEDVLVLVLALVDDLAQ